MDTSLQNGPKLLLDGSHLRPNEEYKISVKLMNGDVIIGSVSCFLIRKNTIMPILDTYNTYDRFMIEFVTGRNECENLYENC